MKTEHLKTRSPETSQEKSLQVMFEEAHNFGFIPIPLDGKRPMIQNWTKLTHDNYDGLLNFWKDRKCNVGILTGPISKIIVVDIDIADQGLETWNEWIQEFSDPLTPKVKTGSGGYHYYFLYEQERVGHFTSRSKFNNVGIDIKTNGGQVVYPGSLHPGCSGKHKCKIKNNGECEFKNISYFWIQSPKDTAIASMPDWLIQKLKIQEKEKPNIPPVSAKTTPSEKVHTKNSHQYFTEEMVSELVNKLSSTRANGYESWLYVIWSLKNLSGKSEKFLDLARNFSKKSEKFDENVFLEKWNQGNSSFNWRYTFL